MATGGESRGATVSVRGRATAFARPDEARCTLSISHVHTTAPTAIGEVTRRAEALAAVLDELGIAPGDRFTSSVVVDEQTEHRNGASVVVGQRASIRVEVRVRDTARVGRLVRDAVDRARAHVSPPRWIVAADNPAQLDAYRAAAVDARRRADAYAGGLGLRAGAALTVTEAGADALPVPAARLASLALPSERAEVPVEAGDLEVSAAVTVTFALDA
jgi:uncharacterized protein